MSDTGTDQMPKGLPETIAAFKKGIDAKSMRVAHDVGPRMAERYWQAFKKHEAEWDKYAQQVLTLARLGGRLAAIYSQRDGRGTVDWTDARFALRDVQAECHDHVHEGLQGKYCRDVDLETP